MQTHTHIHRCMHTRAHTQTHTHTEKPSSAASHTPQCTLRLEGEYQTISTHWAMVHTQVPTHKHTCEGKLTQHISWEKSTTAIQPVLVLYSLIMIQNFSPPLSSHICMHMHILQRQTHTHSCMYSYLQLRVSLLWL